jgi:hypothetical protein
MKLKQLVKVIVVVCLFCSQRVIGQFIINGNASMINCNEYQLTPDLYWQSGNIWNQNMINLNNSFYFNAVLYFGCHDADGADGIAFVLQPISTSIGTAGLGIGYGGISPSLAVEFDTWENTPFDIADDHIAITKNGDVDHLSGNTLVGPICILPGCGNVENCQWYPVIISWDATTQTLQVYVNGNLRVSYTGNIVAGIFGGNPNVYWGFTAATGAAKNDQRVKFNFQVNNVSINNVACFGGNNGSIQVQVFGGVPSYSYIWSNGATSNINNNLAVGTYGLTVTDGSGCSLDTTFAISVITVPAIASSNSPLCAGQTLNLTSGGGTGYNWSGPNSFTSSTQNPSIVGATTTASGTYTVTVTDTVGCTTTAQTTIIVSNPNIPPLVILADGPTDFCEGDTISVTLYTSIPYYTYEWSSGSFTQSIFVNHAGYYYVTVTDTYGCPAACQTPINVRFIPKPKAYINYYASGNYVQFFNYSLFDSTYYWTFGDSSSSILENPAHTYETSGTYPVTFIGTNMCGSDTVNINITIVSGAGIEENNIVQNLVICPIPARDILNVLFETGNSRGIEIKIVNTLGQLLYNESVESFTGKYSKVFSLLKYSSGIYYLQIITDKGIVNRKIVVD